MCALFFCIFSPKIGNNHIKNGQALYLSKNFFVKNKKRLDKASKV